jgi:hypothetical protein
VPIKDRAKRLAYYHANYLAQRAKRIAYAKRYFKEHREWAKEYRRKQIKRIKIEALSAYGGIACKCGESRLEAMTLSHLVPFSFWPKISGRNGSPASGQVAYWRLKRLGWPPMPLVSECMNCNICRDGWGHRK